VSESTADAPEPIIALGARLKQVRQQTGLSLREVARQLGVSPSFVSQLENGKSQPSVATLYSISQLLDVSIDELFSAEAREPAPAPPAAESAHARRGPATRRGPVTSRRGPAVKASVPEPPPATVAEDQQVSRSDLASPADAWGPDDVWARDRGPARLSVTRPGERARLTMDSGVVWEQLATNTGTGLDFIEIIYPPHSTSTTGSRMLQHAGSEFGYLIEGELEVTVGFDVVTLHAGDALGFDSSMPHLLANKTDRPARGIWFVRHVHA
jgi:transcriptional regulator with XRE-family HTH domain